MADDEFEPTSSGASQTYPQQCSALRKNGHVVIKGHPCKIVEMSTSKTGKHGHAKVHLTAIDIFTGKKYEDICPSTHNMNVPNVSRKDYTVVDIDEEFFVTLMDDAGETSSDLCIDESFDGGKGRSFALKQFKEYPDSLLATVLEAMGDRRVISFKTGAK